MIHFTICLREYTFPFGLAGTESAAAMCKFLLTQSRRRLALDFPRCFRRNTYYAQHVSSAMPGTRNCIFLHPVAIHSPTLSTCVLQTSVYIWTCGRQVGEASCWRLPGDAATKTKAPPSKCRRQQVLKDEPTGRFRLDFVTTKQRWPWVHLSSTSDANTKHLLQRAFSVAFAFVRIFSLNRSKRQSRSANECKWLMQVICWENSLDKEELERRTTSRPLPVQHVTCSVEGE